jgi:selenide,water dikinase
MTDVTGFGLIGHALEMSEASGVRFVFNGSDVPLQSAAIALAEQDVRTSGDARNRRSAGERVMFHPEAAPYLDILLHDPQTSGGLLAAVRPEAAARIMREAVDQGISLWDVGEVAEGIGVEIRP